MKALANLFGASDIVGASDSRPTQNKAEFTSNSSGQESAAPIPSAALWSFARSVRELEVLVKEYRELFFGRVQKWLDMGMGACLLRDEELRRSVENAILHFNGIRYVVYAYVVMPNHVHVLFMPLYDNRSSDIVSSWKRYSGKIVNSHLRVHGAFWQKDFWDCLVRNESQFGRFVHYIVQNNPSISWNAWGIR